MSGVKPAFGTTFDHEAMSNGKRPPNWSHQWEVAEGLRQLNENAAAGVIFSTIELGMTFCRLADSSEGHVRAQALARAHRTCTTAEDNMWKLQFDYFELNQMAAQIERLRFEIERLCK
jgi:hypothetical protein